VSARLSAWLARWSLVLPLLAAEGVIALGFGAILPILSIFYTQHGVSLEGLGIVVAAWPAARLIGEPLFGRLADRVSRKAMMVVALVVSAVAVALPVVVSGAAAFIVLRVIAGLGAAAYDPARAARRAVRAVQRRPDGRVHGRPRGGRDRRGHHG